MSSAQEEYSAVLKEGIVWLLIDFNKAGLFGGRKDGLFKLTEFNISCDNLRP